MIGKRNFYIIHKTSNWDGTEGAIIFLTHNYKEAIARFKWLYEEDVYRDFVNDENEPFYEDRNYRIEVDDSNKKDVKVRGNFWYSDCDGSCDYMIDTIKTDHFFYNGNVSVNTEARYHNA